MDYSLGKNWDAPRAKSMATQLAKNSETAKAHCSVEQKEYQSEDARESSKANCSGPCWVAQ